MAESGCEFRPTASNCETVSFRECLIRVLQREGIDSDVLAVFSVTPSQLKERAVKRRKSSRWKGCGTNATCLTLERDVGQPSSGQMTVRRGNRNHVKAASTGAASGPVSELLQIHLDTNQYHRCLRKAFGLDPVMERALLRGQREVQDR